MNLHLRKINTEPEEVEERIIKISEVLYKLHCLNELFNNCEPAVLF